MKKAVTILLLMICSCVTYSQSTAEKRSLERFVYTDRDSLLPKFLLNHQQTLQIHSINMQLGQQERELQLKHANSDSLAGQMKMLEEQKDMQYKGLLPHDKYQLYRQKKLKLMGSDGTIIR